MPNKCMLYLQTLLLVARKSSFLDGDDVGLLADVELELLQAIKLFVELLPTDGTQRV